MGMVVLVGLVGAALLPAAFNLRRHGPRSRWAVRLTLLAVSILGFGAVIGSGHAIATWRSSEQFAWNPAALPMVAGVVAAGLLLAVGFGGTARDEAAPRGIKALYAIAAVVVVGAIAGAWMGATMGAPSALWPLAAMHLAGISACTGALFANILNPD